MALLEIEPATFRFVTQCLKQLGYRVIPGGCVQKISLPMLQCNLLGKRKIGLKREVDRPIK